jgi:hypothetical protein
MKKRLTDVTVSQALDDRLSDALGPAGQEGAFASELRLREAAHLSYSSSSPTSEPTETPPVTKQSTAAIAASSLTRETLEAGRRPGATREAQQDLGRRSSRSRGPVTADPGGDRIGRRR